MRQLKRNSNTASSAFDGLAAGLQARQRVKGGASFFSKAAARVAYSAESMTPSEYNESEIEQEEAASILKEEMGDSQWEEELTEGQRNSGVIVMAASGDPEAYHAAATDTTISGSQDQLDASAVDIRNVSQESYDTREIEKMMPISVAYNVGAARQDDAMEAVWPTISVTADQAGLDIEITRNMIHHHFTHKSQGEQSKEGFGQRNLIHALMDSSILKNQATDIVPVYNDAGIFDEQVGVIPTEVDDTTVDSGAILFNQPFNLIGLGGGSLTDPFGTRDMTDTIDSLVRLKTVYVQITDDAATTSIIPFDVLDLNLTQFQKSQEGNERDVTLNWTTASLTLSGNQHDITGTAAPALAGFRTQPYDKFVIILKMSASGRLNLADGNGELSSGSVTIEGFYRQVTRDDGSQDLERVSDSADIAAAKSKITSIKLRSFRPDARYANLNRRERGLIVRQDVRRYRYNIPLQPPITAIKPVTDTKSSYAVDSAIQATRVFNSTAGVLELMRMDQFLSRYRNASSFQEENNATIGIGAYLVRPYYDHKVVDMTKLINNVNSHSLPSDINTHLTLLIRDSFAKAMMISGWMAAAQCSGNGGKEKPTAVIITDPRTAQYLFIQGDTRLLGDSFNAKPVVSQYLEFRDKIFIVPRRESSVNAPDGLNFGNMFWLPELVTNMPIARGGQISTEFTAQTRRRHICHCPIIIRIDLKHMNKVIDTKVPMSIMA